MSEVTTQPGESTPPAEAPDSSAKGNPGKGGSVFLTILILALVGTTAVFAYLKDGEFFKGLLTKDAWTTQLIANLHPVLMLIPVGLILLVVLVEIGGWLSFGKWRPVTLFALFLAVFSSVLAALSGLVLMSLEGNQGDNWTQYLWYGIGALGALALSFICKIWGKNGNGRGFFYAIFLLAGAGALGYGGYIYGQEVHRYTLVPSRENPETPFGNKLVREGMSEQIVGLEEAQAKLTTDLGMKDSQIASLTQTKETAEKNYRAEQSKVAQALKSLAAVQLEKSEAQKKASTAQQAVTEAQKKTAAALKSTSDVQKALTDARKKLSEAQKKADEASKKAAQLQQEGQKKAQQSQKLQQELQKLKADLEAMKKQAAEKPKAEPAKPEKSAEPAKSE